MIIKEDVWFSPASQTRRLHIYLPDDYDASWDRYPVMYFFDGHNLFFSGDATYGTTWGMKEFLDSWSKKIIIVGVECAHDGNRRLSEYCPYDFSNGWASDMHGAGVDTMRWFVDDLKPYIDSTFRTYSHREATGIGGSSMGGLMALYAVVAHNDVFSKAACVSSAISFCSAQMRALIDRSHLYPDTKAFLSWGSREGRTVKGRAIATSCNKAMNRRLYAKGAQPYMYYQQGGGHNEADWSRQVPVFMNWLWLDTI